jgi:hypothetical protein
MCRYVVWGCLKTLAKGAHICGLILLLKLLPKEIVLSNMTRVRFPRRQLILQNAPIACARGRAAPTCIITA